MPCESQLQALNLSTQKEYPDISSSRARRNVEPSTPAHYCEVHSACRVVSLSHALQDQDLPFGHSLVRRFNWVNVVISGKQSNGEGFPSCQHLFKPLPATRIL